MNIALAPFPDINKASQSKAYSFILKGNLAHVKKGYFPSSDMTLASSLPVVILQTSPNCSYDKSFLLDREKIFTFNSAN